MESLQPVDNTSSFWEVRHFWENPEDEEMFNARVEEERRRGKLKEGTESAILRMLRSEDASKELKAKYANLMIAILTKQS